MNRFSTYLSSSKMSRMHLQVAEENTTNRGDVLKTMRHLIEAQKYALTAMNNAASIGFGVKPKARRKP